MSLPNDVARCDGDDCPKKLQCQRFLELHTGTDSRWVMAAHIDACPFFIPAAEKQDFGD